MDAERDARDDDEHDGGEAVDQLTGLKVEPADLELLADHCQTREVKKGDFRATKVDVEIDQSGRGTHRNLSEILSVAEQSSKAMSLLLGAVASISLIVGGIGIMNIMLVSVTERTREIGIRMAIGAKERDILLQFLTEAVLLTLIGGIIGMALGVGGAKLVSAFFDWPTLISPKAILIAFVFSGAVGIFFGFYPARKAAAMNPIEALRYE